MSQWKTTPDSPLNNEVEKDEQENYLRENLQEFLLQKSQADVAAQQSTVSAQEPEQHPGTMSLDENQWLQFIQNAQQASASAQEPEEHPETMSLDQRQWLEFIQKNRQASIDAIHTGYVCTICKDSFNEYMDLVTHESQLHSRPSEMPRGLDAYKCVKCDKSWDKYPEFELHQLSCFLAKWNGETIREIFLDKYKGFDRYLRQASENGGFLSCPISTCHYHSNSFGSQETGVALFLRHMRNNHARSIEKLNADLLEKLPGQ